MPFLAAEHFVQPPQWTWYILFYFFFAGIAGGSYVLATLLRFGSDPRDEPAARLGFYVSLAAIVVCPILLTADLGASWSRFWHMLIDTTPGNGGLNFKYWSPMSLGVWALSVFGIFAFISAADAWFADRRGEPGLPTPIGRVLMIVGSLLGLFVASYTGVLLSVSNQPVWSDTWALGGLFITVLIAGGAARLLPWFPLWLLALVGIGASLLGFRRPTRVGSGAESVALRSIATEATAVSVLVLLAVLAVRAAVIFSAQ